MLRECHLKIKIIHFNHAHPFLTKSKAAVKAKRIDSNQTEIVKQLRKIGVSVQHLHELGDGCPDLLLGFRGKNYLIELKDGAKPPSKRKLTEDEEKFFAEWRGQVSKCDTLDEILKVIGLCQTH